MPEPDTGEAGEAGEAGARLSRGSDLELGGERTVRAELASIVREAALEVLGPIARRTTTQAAKYMVSKGPTLAKDALAPRLKDTLGPRIEEAGGAGALAKNALASVAGKRGRLLSRLGPGGGDTPDAAELAGGRRLPIHESVDVAVPLETAFSQFTRFEDFAEFVPEAVKVELEDDAHVVWHLRLWGLTREWVTEITSQEPNERIAWRSLDGTQGTGVVTFHSLSDRLTRIEVIFQLEPRGPLAITASRLGIARRALRADLTRFKAFVELREEEAGGSRAPTRRKQNRDREREDRRERARKPTRKTRVARDEYEPDEEDYEPDEEEEHEPEDEEEYEPDDEEEYEDEEEESEAAAEYEEPEAAEEEEPSAAEVEDEEDQEPATRTRRVRRRPPARPIRQSRGRS